MTGTKKPPLIDRRKRNIDYDAILQLHSECIGFTMCFEDETALAQAICDLAVERVGYKQVGIGYMEYDAEKTFRVVAQRGFDPSLVGNPTFKITWDENHPSGQGAIGTCIRDRVPAILNSYQMDENAARWRPVAASHGYNSCIAIPVLIDNEVIGAMAFYSENATRFDAIETQYLQRLVDDVGHAIKFIRLRQKEEKVRVALAAEEANRRELEEKLAEARKMEAIGRLAGGVAHDFNNKLAVINTNVETAAGWLDPTSREFQRLSAAMKATKSAAALVAGLLAFARRQPLHPRVIDVGATVRGIVAFMERLIGPTVAVVIDCAPLTWPVSVDPTGFESAVMNFLTNARDAIGIGEGRIQISINNVVLDEATDVPLGGQTEYVCIEILDNGCGIPPEVLPRVFEPFFTTKDIGKGTGLGLSSAYGFVQQSKGFLRLTSEIGIGTRLSMFLPRAQGEIDANAELPKDVRNLPPLTILFVEDEEDLRLSIASILEGLGMTVIQAATAHQAMRKMDGFEKVDLLFTDYGLHGGMTGIGLTERFLARHPAGRVLITSGNIDVEDLNTVVHVPGVHFLQKPYGHSALKESLKILVDSPIEGREKSQMSAGE